MAEPHEYSTPVYREVDTGKIRIKGTTKIEDVTESPADAAEIAVALNAVLALLTEAGINDDVAE